jgi:ornithine cyclodeaminase/alanine dehydrogenase-like protein (mu-crystallin family)
MFPRARDFAEVRVAGRGEFEDAVRGADVVHATTAAQEPVVRFDWLSPGTHVSSVGSSLEGGSELDPAIVERADVVVVEQRDSAFAPLPAGAPELEPRGRDGVVELGEIVAGTAVGRSSNEQITLYKSVGVAVQDLAAAALVLAAARERGAGQEIELEEIHA